jgi:hypothetical protein
LKDENGDLLADSHNVLSRWKKYYQLFKVPNVGDVKQREEHTVEPLVPGSSRLEVEIATAKLKNINRQILTKFRHEVKQYCLRIIDSLILFGIRKNCLISRKSPLMYQFTKWGIKLTVVIIVEYHRLQLHKKYYPISSSQD